MMSRLKKLFKETLKSLNLEIKRIDGRPSVLFEIDSDFNTLYLTALEKTQMLATDNLLKRQRNYTLMQLLKQALPVINAGNVAECGCWRGASAYQTAYHLKNNHFKNKFYIFDSFEGLSDFQREDLENNRICDTEKRKKEFSCSLEVVKENLKEFDFIEYKKGWIPSRFNEADSLKFSFVHIDVDLYRPIKDSLEFFYPRMVEGGIIALDDYGYLGFPGAKRAVDEFVEGKGIFFLPLPSGEAFIIKRTLK